MSTQTIITTLTVIECGECGVTFGMTEAFVAARRADHRGFYCPNGHSRYYPQKSEAEKLRDRLRSAEAQLTHTKDQLQATEYQRRAQKGKNTRLKNRIAHAQVRHDHCIYSEWWATPEDAECMHKNQDGDIDVAPKPNMADVPIDIEWDECPLWSFAERAAA